MKYTKLAALLVALFTIVVSTAGLVTPDRIMAFRRSYFTPGGLYLVGAVRVGMGLAFILAAPGTRWPKTIRALGALMCMQAVSANLLGLERARAILEWEAMHTALLRAGAVVALVTNGFVVFAVTQRPPNEKRKAAHSPASS